MEFGDFSRLMTEELGARLLVSGEGERDVSGIAIEEDIEGWLNPDEAAVTSRKQLDEAFLKRISEAGSPAVVWRSGEDTDPEVLELAKKLNVAILRVAPEVPLREIFSIFSGGNELLLLSHAASRKLLGDVDSVETLTNKVSEMLGRGVVLEDPVGRLVKGGSGGERLAATLEGSGLRASRASSVDETRRERRDRYARLPDGFLSVPVERWRTAEGELHWTPIGSQTTSGYLWVDLEESPLSPKDVVRLYWARRALETELGKERIRLETELGVRGDFVDDLITGHYGSVDLLLQRARYLGAELQGGALVLIVDIDDFAKYLERRKLKEPAIQELKRRLADAVRLQARQLFENFLTGPRSDNVILFIGSSEGEPKEDLPEKANLLATQTQRYVKGLLPDLTVSVGIGRYKSDPAMLPDAYSEAEVSLEIGHRIKGPSSISTFEETGTYKLLFKVLQDDPEELETFYAETLEPAVSYDTRYGTELVETMIAYLGNDASTVKTASELFAHRHTIRYRLDRISELTGLNVEKSEDRERITLGIKAMQLLGRAPSKPSNFRDR